MLNIFYGTFLLHRAHIVCTKGQSHDLFVQKKVTRHNKTISNALLFYGTFAWIFFILYHIIILSNIINNTD
jgi:hypothetical protein